MALLYGARTTVNAPGGLRDGSTSRQVSGEGLHLGRGRGRRGCVAEVPVPRRAALGTNKAEALAQVFREGGFAIQAIAAYVTPDNVGLVVREGDLVLLAVDNHPTRALVDRHIAGLSDVTLISGGNDETDGNVQLVRRRDGYSVDGHLVEIHPEIGQAADAEVMPGTGCAVLAAERPQLVVTNLMVASAMLNALWAVTEQGSVPYSEVYLDVVHNAARSRSWFRVPDGAQ